MKVIHFKQDVPSDLPHPTGYTIKGFYIPFKNIILGSRDGSRDYFLSKDPELIKGILEALRGNHPTERTSADAVDTSINGTFYSEIKEFEYDSITLEELIQRITSRNELVMKIESGVNELTKRSD